MAVATREVVLNLRRYQKKFLELLATATQSDPSDICQRLIELEVRGVAPPDDEMLGSPVVIDALLSFHREYGDSKWGRLPVLLTDTHADHLEKLATQLGISASKALRHLLARCIASYDVDASRSQVPGGVLGQAWDWVRSVSYTTIATGVLLLVLAGIIFYALQGEMYVKVGPHWAADEASIIFDPHTHTIYSEASKTPTELVSLAMDNGCDAMVISDNAANEGAVSNEQLLELELLREQFPDFLLFNGVELNMPSYGGREHAGLIADPLIQSETLQELRDVAELSLRKAKNVGSVKTSDRRMLSKIADHQSLQNGLLLMYNHPTRSDASAMENYADLEKWNEHAPVFSLLEGGPGHQRATVPGEYEKPHLTEDGWDPAVANVGGVWDQWLASGKVLWGALASSGFYDQARDYPPCAFSRTHLSVPEQSYRGAMMALRSGTFWADHGRILNQLWFSLSVEGLEQAAYPGYEIHVGSGEVAAQLKVEIERGPGSDGQPLGIEYITNCADGEFEQIAGGDLAPTVSSATTPLTIASVGVDGKSCTVRARLRLERAGDRDYLAYTNPIRVLLR